MRGDLFRAVGPAQAAVLVHAPNAWVHIAEDDTFTLLNDRSEMGQGFYTSMPIAEELNVDIRQIKMAFASPPKVSGSARFGIGVKLPGMVFASLAPSATRR